MTMANFFLAGAPKCGTSYVVRAMGRHPDIFVPPSKEPAFFSLDPKHGCYQRGTKFYEKNFENSGGCPVIVDASTLYFYDPTSAELIRRNIPDARIGIILRNPVERVYSNYWQYRKSGFRLPTLEEMLKHGDKTLEHMINVSCYGRHLTRFLTTFGKDRMRVFLYEELKSDPVRLFQDIFEFIEVDSSVDESWFPKERENPSGMPKSRILARLLRQKNIIQGIKAIIPAGWIEPGRNWLEKVRWRNTTIVRYPPLDLESRAALWMRLREVPEEVERQTSLDVNAWKADRESALNSR
jgi:hypothetical protein